MRDRTEEEEKGVDERERKKKQIEEKERVSYLRRETGKWRRRRKSEKQRRI